MFKNKKISVVIPCYNEEKTIGKVLKEMPDFVDEIIVVDNNSSDMTAEIARKYGARVIKEKNQGVGWATQRGMMSAKGDVLVIMDGDGQHNPCDIRKFLDLMSGRKTKVVFGTRFYEKAQGVKSGSRARDFGNRIQTFFFNLLFRTKISDSQCGMWVFDKKILREISLKSGGFSIVEEFKTRVINRGIEFGELPIDCKRRKGPSRLSPVVDGFKNLIFLLKLFYELRIKKGR